MYINIIQIMMIEIIQVWKNLNVHQYHPNSDGQNHPTMDEFKHELISSKYHNHPTVDELKHTSISSK